MPTASGASAAAPRLADRGGSPTGGRSGGSRPVHEPTPLPGHARRDAAQPQPHFGGGRRLARVAAVEDHVLHAVAAQALRALLAEHPGDRVDDVALAAAVGADDGGDARVEGELGAVGKALEAGDFETIQPHIGRTTTRTKRLETLQTREVVGIQRLDNGRYIPSTQHPASAGWPLGPRNGGQSNKAPYLGQALI